MNNNIVITCVTENTSLHYSLLAQHGQSLHINYFGEEYLFDTGEIYEGFVYNLKHLNINLDTIKTLIMSHAHLDHFGALPKTLSQLTNQRLLLPPDIENLRNSDKNGYLPDYRNIDGKQMSVDEMIAYVKSYAHKESTDKPLQLAENFYTTGFLPGPDTQEQSLIIDIPDKGLVVIVACSHPTIPVIIEKAKEVTGVAKIYGIIGGLHYKGLDDQEIAKNVTYLQSLNTSFIVPSHCTGYRAIRKMQDVLGDVIKVSGTGQFGIGNSVTVLPELVFNLPQK